MIKTGSRNLHAFPSSGVVLVAYKEKCAPEEAFKNRLTKKENRKVTKYMKVIQILLDQESQRLAAHV